MTMMATSVGWIGAAGTVGAYALVSLRRLDAHSLRFQLINVMGAALLAISALSTHNWPSMVSNLVWMYLGVHALTHAREALRAGVGNRVRALRRQSTVLEVAPEPADSSELVAA
jgi:hypothetical protein